MKPVSSMQPYGRIRMIEREQQKLLDFMIFRVFSDLNDFVTLERKIKDIKQV